MTYREKHRRDDARWISASVLATIAVIGMSFALLGCATSEPDPSTMALRHAEVWCVYAGFVGDELQSCINVVATEMEAN